MKNKEKSANEIAEIATNGMTYAVDKNTGKICACTCSAVFGCSDCYFNPGNYPNSTDSCIINRKHWANSEYVERKEFTEQEKAVLRGLDYIEWVTKNDFGRISGHIDKPIKSQGKWLSCQILALDEVTSARFEAIKSTDTEPTSREEILGKGK